MILARLAWVFFVIGCFTFGGGYAMLPLIQQQMARQGWLTPAEFVSIVAVAELTPGPLAANTATFVGYRAAGVAGAVLATLSLALPSLVSMSLLARVRERTRHHPLADHLVFGIRAAVAGLIAGAALQLMRALLWTAPAGGATLPASWPDAGAALLAVLAFLLLLRRALHPMLVVAAAAVAGMLVF